MLIKFIRQKRWYAPKPTPNGLKRTARYLPMLNKFSPMWCFHFKKARYLVPSSLRVHMFSFIGPGPVIDVISSTYSTLSKATARLKASLDWRPRRHHSLAQLCSHVPTGTCLFHAPLFFSHHQLVRRNTKTTSIDCSHWLSNVWAFKHSALAITMATYSLLFTACFEASARLAVGEIQLLLKVRLPRHVAKSTQV